jgi:hypothetical protein
VDYFVSAIIRYLVNPVDEQKAASFAEAILYPSRRHLASYDASSVENEVVHTWEGAGDMLA